MEFIDSLPFYKYKKLVFWLGVHIFHRRIGITFKEWKREYFEKVRIHDSDAIFVKGF